MLRIDIQSCNAVATLACSGRLVFGVETETLRTMVQSRPEEDLRIDLSGLKKIDAAGLGALVELSVWAREAGRTLTLVDLPENVWRLVSITRLHSALEISYSGVPALDRESEGFDRDEMIA